MTGTALLNIGTFMIKMGDDLGIKVIQSTGIYFDAQLKAKDLANEFGWQDLDRVQPIYEHKSRQYGETRIAVLFGLSLKDANVEGIKTAINNAVIGSRVGGRDLFERVNDYFKFGGYSNVMDFGAYVDSVEQGRVIERGGYKIYGTTYSIIVKSS